VADPRDKDLLARAGELLSGLFGSGSAPRASDRPTPQLAQDRRDAQSGLAAFLQRQTAASGVLRYRSRPGEDCLVAPGEAVEFSVALDAVLGAAAQRVRFFVGEEPLGEQGFGPERVAWVPYQATRPGVHELRYQVLDAAGNPLDGAPGQESLLQVVDRQPVALVEGGLALEASAADLEPLRDLAARGWALAYLDLTQRDRSRDLRRALSQRNLPRGAVLVHATRDTELHSLGVDFRQVLARTTLRRLRAAGVPVVLFVGQPSWMQSAQRDGELQGLALDALPAALQAPSPLLAELEGLAEQFCAARESSDPLTWRLDRMTRTRLVGGNTCQIEFDNARAREAVLQAVESAQRSVHAQVYIFKDCDFTQALTVRLVSRARAGVAVRLLVDGLYSGPELIAGGTQALLRVLAQQPGVTVQAADPIRAASELEAMRFKQRDHRKLIIVDGTQAFVSGRNFGDEYYRDLREQPIGDWTPAERIPWLDAHAALRGPLVAEIEATFWSGWTRAGGAASAAGAEAPPQSAHGACRARFVVHEGVADANALGAYEALMDAARQRLVVVNDFPVVDSLAAAMRRAVARGVQVQFLTGNANARRADGTLFSGGLHRELFEYLTKQRFEALMQHGVEVWEYASPVLPTIVSRGGQVRPYVHAKVVCCDGRALSVGSANLDLTASYWEREAIVVVEDPGVAGAALRHLDEMLARSYRIDPTSEYWRKEATQRALVGKLWPRIIL